MQLAGILFANAVEAGVQKRYRRMSEKGPELNILWRRDAAGGVSGVAPYAVFIRLIIHKPDGSLPNGLVRNSLFPA